MWNLKVMLISYYPFEARIVHGSLTKLTHLNLDIRMKKRMNEANSNFLKLVIHWPL